MDFIITELLVLLIIIGLFLILSGVWPPDSPWAPWWQMPEDVIRKMCKLAKISSNDTIYDLGCGTGKALCIAAKEYGARGVGIEIDPIRVWLARWNVNKIKGNPLEFPLLLGEDQGEVSVSRGIDIKILKKNFFDINISPASVIFVYLVPKALRKLLPKFIKELKPGTRIISYMYNFPNCKEKKKLRLIQYDKKSKIFLYKLLS